jgi:Protein of unknown function (DUF5818)
MKKVNALAVSSLLALVLGLSTQVIAQSASQDQNETVQQQSTQDQPQQQPDMPSANAESKTFMGKIVKASGKLVLQDTANKITYQLDDQDKAKQFAGKDVKVTGTLDTTSGVIRVAAIEPAA